jgi:hypothetical protein
VSSRQLDLQLQRQSDSLARTRRELQEVTEKHKGLVEELHVKVVVRGRQRRMADGKGCAERFLALRFVNFAVVSDSGERV